MSGGVDSSVAAFLLKQQGHDVHGIFMKNWQEDDEHCSAEKDAADARSVCAQLDIPFTTVNFSANYWDNVFQHFLNEYQAGRTPNPDVLCNREIKFTAFLDYALSLGADFIATGHYARNIKKNNTYNLCKGLDNSKDQSYFLYLLNQAQLAKSVFPIGELDKRIVRDIAKKAGFITHDKKDSTGLCFIGERKFKNFLQEYLPARPGDIEDDQGTIIAHHEGLMYYTLGQRKGLHIGGLEHYAEAAWYVLGKDLKRNVLIVGQHENHPLLFSNTVAVSHLHWISNTAPSLPLSCYAKIRYRQKDQPCRVSLLSETGALVHFDEPQRAVTPGQSIVFYQDEECLGGAIITGTRHS